MGLWGSRFTRDFDSTIAWLAFHFSRKAVAEYFRIDWNTVGRCISRAREDIEPDLKARLDGPVNIGIDETSYRKGHNYLSVILHSEIETRKLLKETNTSCRIYCESFCLHMLNVADSRRSIKFIHLL